MGNLWHYLTKEKIEDMVFLDVNILGTSVGLGSILAVVLSWSRNQSILWAIIHACFGWLYVIYFAFSR